MGKPFLEIKYDPQVKNRKYKSFFKKFMTFIRYNATVGIHSNDGKKDVTRYYTQDFSVFKAGKSHKMTLIKLAYQNEFGANILIKPRYKDTKIKVGYPKKIHTKYKTYTKQRYEIRSELASSKEQGFLLLKNSKFLMYKKPGDYIRIPSRSFIRKVVTNPSKKMISRIKDILASVFSISGKKASTGFKEIAKTVKEEIQENIRNTDKQNHPITVKNKGFNSPLLEQQDRIYKAIKYKIYKDIHNKESKGWMNYKIQANIHKVDKLLKSAEVFLDKGFIDSFVSKENVKTWGNKYNKQYNPYYKRRRK